MAHREPYSYRVDPDVPDFEDAGPVAVMDAACGLCAKGASWIARNDWREEFKIVPIQSDLGRAIALHYAVDPDDPATWLIVAEGRGLGGFDAMLWASGRFGGLWAGVTIFKIVPRALRDALYAWVARNRYRVFGRRDLCALPDPRVQARLAGHPPTQSRPPAEPTS